MLPTRKQWKKWSLPSKYTALGLLIAVVCLGFAIYSSVQPKSKSDGIEVISGEIVITSLGEHEINYGVNFLSKPKLEFWGGKYGGIENPNRFEITEQRTDGFKFIVGGALTSGTTIIWQATGKIEDLIDKLQTDYTIVIVTHNMQQAARVSKRTAFFCLGELIEYDSTVKIFRNPSKKQTEDYVTGRFG